MGTSLFAQGSGGHYGCPFIGRDADLPLHVSRVIIFAPAFDLSVGRDFEHGIESCSYLFVVVEQCHRSEEHTSELQSLMRISYDVFCLKKKKTNTRET